MISDLFSLTQTVMEQFGSIAKSAIQLTSGHAVQFQSSNGSCETRTISSARNPPAVGKQAETMVRRQFAANDPMRISRRAILRRAEACTTRS
jgi:hypothetical protein